MIAAIFCALSFASAHHALSNVAAWEQAAFDRGLTLYYAYNGAQGVRVFQAAVDRDPKFAMAYWGLALSYGPDINSDPTEDHFNRAHSAIEKAASLESSVSAPERAYIEAMRARYAGPWRDHATAESAYRAAMAKAVARYPADDDLASLYAEALLEKTGALAWKSGTNLPLSSDTLTMAALLARIVARSPEQLMANHLLIHLYGSAADQSKAIPAAKKLDNMNFAPEDEHLAHMPAHTWVRVGNYADAVSSSKRAIALFDEYLAQANADRTHRGYLAHDIEIGWGAALMLGSYAGAKWFANRLDTLEDTSHAMRITALRFNDLKSLDAFANDAGASKEERAIFSGYAAALRGENNAANTAFNAVLTPQEKSPIVWAMAGRTKLLNGNHAAAQNDFHKAQGLEEERYFGENLPHIPVGEIEGFSYYRIGDYPTAEKIFRRTLNDFPNDPRALYGLSLTLQKAGHNAEAQRVAANFRRLWEGADTTLSAATL